MTNQMEMDLQLQIWMHNVSAYALELEGIYLCEVFAELNDEYAELCVVYCIMSIILLYAELISKRYIQCTAAAAAVAARSIN